MTDPAELERVATILEASEDYRVLRRLKPSSVRQDPGGEETRQGLFVDVETTGLDPENDEIIELAMLPFRYTLSGRIVEVQAPFDKLRQPSKPIPEAVTALTGITDEMVSGQTIDDAEASEFARDADLVLAHNAAFDRPFLERLLPAFREKPWACSMAEVDWAEEGFEGLKLAYLTMEFGFFYDRHRAANDCLAAVELLARPLPVSGIPAMANLLANARKQTWRIWAENAPFDLKDVLKARGYRWSNGERGQPRAWYIDVSDDARAQEEAFLRGEIYNAAVELNMKAVSAFDRYSDRVKT